MRTKLFVSALLSATMMAGSATLAADEEINASANAGGQLYSSVQSLPKDGPVSIIGTVESNADNTQKFTLVDDQGKTIDVNTNANISFEKGERVKVDGMAESEFLGMGHEINQANASSLSELAPASGNPDKDSSRMGDQSKNDSDKNSGIGSMTGATGVRMNQAPNDKTTHTNADKVPSYDVDTDVSADKDADGADVDINAELDRTQSLKDAKEAAESTSNTKPKQISN